MSSPPIDPYKILGVSRDAQVPEIRSAHRKLVLQCHPDKVQDAELKAKAQDEFQRVQRAYEILSDEDQRAKCDDKLKLAELRAQYANKPNSSAPRSSPSKVYAEFEIRTAEPRESRESRDSRSSSYKGGPSPSVKIYPSYSRSYDEDKRGPRYYDAEPRSRREQSYSERPSKRELEREREQREREKRRARKEKEAAAEEARAAEKAAEKAAKKDKEKRAKEKQRSKDHKREKEDKRAAREDVYIEPYDDEPPSLPRKSSSKKYDDKRERSSHRDDIRQPPPRMYSEPVPPSASDFARAYITRSRDTGPERSQSYHSRAPQPPHVPTPPPAGGGAFTTPEDEEEVLRSSAPKTRRASADVPSTSMPRDRSYRKSSREPMDDPHIVDASPPRGISRTNTMPVEKSGSRPHGMPKRAATYHEPSGGVEIGGNRGRGRNRMYSQVPVEEDSEEEYEEPPRRSTKSRGHKTRSSERQGHGTELRYHVDGGRTKLQSSQSYTRKLNQEPASYYTYDTASYQPAASPPHAGMYTRQPAMSNYAGSPYKVRTSKYDDVAFSAYGAPHYEEYAAAR